VVLVVLGGGGGVVLPGVVDGDVGVVGAGLAGGVGVVGDAAVDAPESLGVAGGVGVDVAVDGVGGLDVSSATAVLVGTANRLVSTRPIPSREPTVRCIGAPGHWVDVSSVVTLRIGRWLQVVQAHPAAIVVPGEEQRPGTS